VRDSVFRGEAPIASHLLFTQRGILRDANPVERKMGIEAGLAWRGVADASVVYVDRGISSGMRLGLKAAADAGLQVEYRSLAQRSVPWPRLAAAARRAPVRAANGGGPEG
jgi:hypothetical protein